MGFKEVRALLIEALRSGVYESEERSDSEWKNLLASHVVDEDTVIRSLLRCKGWEYSTSRHHFLDTDCHIFTPTVGGEQWYIKAYWRHGLAVLVSVHR